MTNADQARALSQDGRASVLNKNLKYADELIRKAAASGANHVRLRNSFWIKAASLRDTVYKEAVKELREAGF